METNKERQLIENCLNGKMEDFGELYQIYADKIFKFIYYKTHHRETAEDLTSQTFIKALQGISSFNPDKGKFSSWLYKIAKNLVIDHYRATKIEENVEDIWDLSSKENVARDAEISDQIEQVKKYLLQFKKEQREIILMRVWGELSYAEIAEITGLSESNCKVIFSRAINKLRQDEIFMLGFLIALLNLN